VENSSNNNLRRLDLIPMKFWSTSGDIFTTSNSVKADFKARSSYTAIPLSRQFLLSDVRRRTPSPTCKSQHDELLNLSSFVQGDGADSPRVLRSFPYAEN
jgi:hypothetical protein